MTLFELQAETARLGFLPEIKDQTFFVACANRALLRVNGLRPRQKNVRLLHLTEADLLDGCAGIIVATSPISLRAVGARAYAFYGVGEGILRIYAEDPAEPGGEALIGERVISGEAFYQGGIWRDATPIPAKTGVRLEFLPMDLLQIEAPALYAMEMPARDGRQTTSTAWFDYDLAQICDEFLSCEGLCAIAGVRYRRGDIVDGRRSFLPTEPVVDAAALGLTMPASQVVRIPMDAPGVYTVTCFTAPTRLTGDATQTVDVPADLAVLLPLLCAAELFYEEDPEKSAFYLKQYEAQAADICRNLAPMRAIPITHASGW